ncbi:MAG: hypothetical protein EHM48_00300 [Planctomycetaceae bacterium]|nr:MAG: hypothetical protein EHM48_00300 [Planctomycetaceae bacterium]
MRKTIIIFVFALLLGLMSACPSAFALEATTAPAEAAAAKSNGNGNGHKLTAQQEQDTLDFLQRTGSDQYKKLVDLRQVNPQTYQSTIRAWYVWMDSIRRFPPTIQQAFIRQQEANTRLYRLVASLRIAAGDDRKKELTVDIRKTVGDMFDAQAQVREHRINELEDQLRQLRAANEKAKTSRDQIIEENVKAVIKSATQPADAPLAMPKFLPASQPAE